MWANINFLLRKSGNCHLACFHFVHLPLRHIHGHLTLKGDGGRRLAYRTWDLPPTKLLLVLMLTWDTFWPLFICLRNQEKTSLSILNPSILVIFSGPQKQCKTDFWNLACVFHRLSEEVILKSHSTIADKSHILAKSYWLSIPYKGGFLFVNIECNLLPIRSKVWAYWRPRGLKTSHPITRRQSGR